MKAAMLILLWLPSAIAMDNFKSLSIIELRRLRDEVNLILYNKQFAEIEIYMKKIISGEEFDPASAVELAHNAWIDALSEDKKLHTISFIKMLVSKGLAYEIALKIAQEIQQANLGTHFFKIPVQVSLVNASLELFLALVLQDQVQAYADAEAAIFNWKSSYDYSRRENTNREFEDNVCLLANAMEKSGKNSVSRDD